MVFGIDHHNLDFPRQFLKEAASSTREIFRDLSDPAKQTRFI